MLVRTILSLGLVLCVAGPTLAASPTPDTAAVELVEFASFQCPFSAREEAVVNDLQKRYGDKLTVRYMHLPLAFQVRARPAAIASEAARRQGKFDLMHEKLFANQQHLEDADLRAYAEAIGLDLARYDKDIADPALGAEVDRQALVAGAVGATGTPTFFVNGKQIMGAQPIDKFTEVIDAELAVAGKQGGAQWRSQRTAANSPAVQKYVIAGEKPPFVDVVVGGKEGLEPPPPMPAPAVTLEAETHTIDTKGALQVGAGKNVVVVFGGMQCPYTGKALPHYVELQAAHPEAITLVYKQYPLDFQKMSRPAGEAVACAGEQHLGWPLALKVFAHSASELSEASLAAWSQDVGLNMKKQAACLRAGRGKKAVDKDVSAAAALGVNATPTVFVNGRKLSSWSGPSADELLLTP